MFTTKKMTRRGFMMGCSAAIAALAGSRLTRLAFAAPTESVAPSDQNMLVVVFLRGGWDALNVFPPLAGDDRRFYEEARPSLKVRDSGYDAALNLNDQLGLHPALAPLHGLYQDGKMAVVQAVGLNHDTRSHFDAMEFIERGTPGKKSTTSGWISRHLESAPNLPQDILMPALAASGQPTSLLACNEAVTMGTPADFALWSSDGYQAEQREALRRMYSGDSWLRRAGAQTLKALDVVQNGSDEEYTPANGAYYPEDYFGENLKTIAQMIKRDVGLRVGTVDLGGWDTHEYQGEGGGGYLSDLLGQLARGLEAFYTDLDGAYTDRLTVVVMSEFGRRLAQNASYGTDHGHGSAMLALGGQINGGQVFGAWPGLHNDQLYDRADLAVSTDYRQVLGEILLQQLGNPNLDYVFPGYTGYQPLGIVKA
jgi:uncharacterized protein (DUF1501 family)